MNIANRIKSRREELRLKVKDVAAHIGVAESTYRDWENGRSIQGEPYLKIAEILDISISELLGVDRKAVVSEFLMEVELLDKHVKNIRKNVIQIL